MTIDTFIAALGDTRNVERYLYNSDCNYPIKLRTLTGTYWCGNPNLILPWSVSSPYITLHIVSAGDDEVARGRAMNVEQLKGCLKWAKSKAGNIEVVFVDELGNENEINFVTVQEADDGYKFIALSS